MFWKSFNLGQLGNNMGLSTGLECLDRAIDGIQRKSIYGIAAPPKAGKTTLTDFILINAILDAVDKNIPIKVIYFSYEIDVISKMYDFAAFFFYHKYREYGFKHNGKDYEISPRYLKGRLKDPDAKEDDEIQIIQIKPKHKEMLEDIYTEYIIPFFGEYDDNRNKIKDGYINVIEERTNPTGMQTECWEWAKQTGEIIRAPYIDDMGLKKHRVTGYIPNDPNAFTIIVTDHVRKIKPESKMFLKGTVDKWSDYCVQMRNLFGYTFIHIVHLNRNLSSIDRIKFNKETLHPTGEDVKDTGNLSEDCNYLLTMFNPADEKYQLVRHFGNNVKAIPGYRSLHLVDSRDTECPSHCFLQMNGAIKYFQEI